MVPSKAGLALSLQNAGGCGSTAEALEVGPCCSQTQGIPWRIAIKAPHSQVQVRFKIIKIAPMIAPYKSRQKRAHRASARSRSRPPPPSPSPSLKNSSSSHGLQDKDLEPTNLAPLRTQGCLDPHHLDLHLVLQRPQPVRKDLQVSPQVPDLPPHQAARPVHSFGPLIGHLLLLLHQTKTPLDVRQGHG